MPQVKELILVDPAQKVHSGHCIATAVSKIRSCFSANPYLNPRVLSCTTVSGLSRRFR